MSRYGSRCAALLLGVFCAGWLATASAVDPLVLFLLRMMRDSVLSTAIERGANAAQEKSRVEELPRLAALPSTEGPWLKTLIDDSFVAAGTWDARMRSAEDLIARAETDNRGVALIPMSEPSRDISFETPAAARVRLKQMRPKPYAIERSDMLVPLGRFFGATADVEVMWLTDGVDLGGGSEFAAALSRIVGSRSITVVEGGLAPAHALAGAENNAGCIGPGQECQVLGEHVARFQVRHDQDVGASSNR